MTIANPYEVGKFYMVPTVRGQWHHLTRDWPVMGGKHDDHEHIGFKEPHYHIDWRFVGRPWIDEFTAAFKGLADNPLAKNYATPLIDGKGQRRNSMNMSGLPAPVIRRRKCHRAHVLPWDLLPIKWMPALERAYAGCKLAAGHICPHRGFDLSREPVSPEGIVVCPLHGLRWNVLTGEAAPRDCHSGSSSP